MDSLVSAYYQSKKKNPLCTRLMICCFTTLWCCCGAKKANEKGSSNRFNEPTSSATEKPVPTITTEKVEFQIQTDDRSTTTEEKCNNNGMMENCESEKPDCNPAKSEFQCTKIEETSEQAKKMEENEF